MKRSEYKYYCDSSGCTKREAERLGQKTCHWAIKDVKYSESVPQCPECGQFLYGTYKDPNVHAYSRGFYREMYVSNKRIKIDYTQQKEKRNESNTSL